MTRTILNGLAVAALTLITSTSAQACLVTGQRVAELSFDRVFPREASSALRKEAELRGRQFLVSTQRTNRLNRRSDSLLRLKQLDRATQKAEQLDRLRHFHLVNLGSG